MKKKLAVFFILIILFGGGIAAKYFFLNNQNKEGKLKVLSSPSASLFLNNAPIGKTPYEDKALAGEYILKLIPEGTATDAASWQGKIKIYKNSLTYVDRELGASDLTSAGVILTTTKMSTGPKNKEVGEVEVETEPSGGIVYLDNDEKGIAPLILTDVSKGEHELSVYSPGFFRRTQKINVEAEYRTVGVLKLALDQSQEKLEDEETPATGSAQTEKSDKDKKSASPSGKIIDKKIIVVVQNTPTGWLRVREEPSLSASESAKVNPKDTFKLIDEKDGWYKISYEKDKEGWISARYAKKQEK